MIELLNPPLYKPQFGHTRLKQGHPLNQGLVGWWLMNEGGGLKAYDLSGKGNHGTLTNGPTWTTGQRGQALSFDGANDYVDLGNPVSLQITGSLTISAWIKLASLPAAWNAYQIVAKDKDTGGRAYTFDVYNDSLGAYGTVGIIARFYINGGSNNQNNGSDTVAGNSTLSANVWYHLVGVYNASGTLDIYLNGASDHAQITGESTSIPAATGSVNIGRREYAGFEGYLPGSIDDVRIYNRALSAGEIQSLYSDPLAALEPIPSIIWAPSAGGGTTHTTSGDLVGPGATVAGTATRFRAHATDGILVGPGAVVTGTAAHVHATSGALEGSGATIAGTAAHTAPGAHATSGDLIGSGATIAGTATHIGMHPTSGALVGVGAAVTGSAAHIVIHATSGDLIGSGAVIAGTATHPGATTLTAADLLAIDALITAQLPNIAAAVLAAYVEGTTTVQQALRLYDAVLGGKVSGSGTSTETFRDLADTKDRIVATVDSSGNRTVVTRDLS